MSIDYGETEFGRTSGMPQEMRDFQAKGVPAGRFSEPVEQTAQVLLLLSPHSGCA